VTEPRFCYIVLCHTRADAVARNARRIRELSPTSDVMLRYDVPGLMDERACAEMGVQTYEDDITVRWGDWTMVEAQLRALREARRRSDASHFVLLSGQDYPIRDLASWESGVATDGSDAVLDLHGDSPETYTWTWRHLPGPEILRRVTGPLAWRAAHRLPGQLQAVRSPTSHHWYVGVPRRAAAPVPVVKAAVWATLSARAVDRLLAVTDQRPELPRFFRTTRTPDELYTSSVLSAQADLQVRTGRTTYADFPEGASNPEWVDAALLARAADTPAAFVRKMHPDVDPDVLRLADELVHARPSPSH